MNEGNCRDEQLFISVIIPVYNVDRFLIECIESVLSQTYKKYEIIIIDDGSTDQGGQICDEYLASNSSIQVVHSKNGGLSYARNTGIKIAKGDYLYFLDSDDYITNDALEKLAVLAKETHADVVFFDADVFFTDCTPDPNVYKYERTKKYRTDKGQKILLELLDTDEYRSMVQLLFIRKDYLEKIGLWFREGIIHEDELFTFLLLYGNGIISHCHEQLYARRIRLNSIMTGSSLVSHYISVYKIYFELSNLFKKGQLKGVAAKRYLARMSRSVIAKYKALDRNSQIKYKRKHKRFRKDVIKCRGFDDMKLKLKCSSGVRHQIYRIQNKLKKQDK